MGTIISVWCLLEHIPSDTGKKQYIIKFFAKHLSVKKDIQIQHRTPSRVFPTLLLSQYRIKDSRHFRTLIGRNNNNTTTTSDWACAVCFIFIYLYFAGNYILQFLTSSNKSNIPLHNADRLPKIMNIAGFKILIKFKVFIAHWFLSKSFDETLEFSMFPL